MIESILDMLKIWISTTGLKIAISIIILFIGFKVIKKIINIINTIFEKRKLDLTISRFLEAMLGISLKGLLLLLVMEYIGLKTSGLIALIGSAGLAVGLALQGSLSNFAGGVIILLLRPFNVGDLIDSGEYSGVVERIGIFYTYLTTFDNKQILIPNGDMANKSIVNYNGKDTRRVDLIFSVGYEENILKVKNAIYYVIENQELILTEPEPFVNVNSYGESAVDFIVRVWTKTENYWTVYFNLLEQVKMKFDEENISIPYNHIDINIKNHEY